MNASRDDFLKRISVMAGLSDAALSYLAGLAGEERYPAGAVIVREGEPGNRMFFISDGRVQVIKGHGTARPVALAEFAAGDFFGEMSLIDTVPRSASVVALEATMAFTLKGTDLYQLYRRQPDQYGIVMLNISRDLARRLRKLDDKYHLVSQ